MPPDLHISNLHSKNLSTSKPGKKNLVAAPKNIVGKKHGCQAKEDMPEPGQLLQLLLQPQRKSCGATGRTCPRAADSGVSAFY